MGGSDKRLVRRAARGDRGAFEEIYRRYHPDLFRFCLTMTGNRQDAQDALQNTMVKVLRALPGEERQIALKPWLYRIARNETVEVLRKRRDNDELTLDRTATSTVVEAAETREHLRTLLSDLEQLPQRQRAVLLMRELAGLGFVEIGAAFETSAAAARQTLYEARLSLRQLEEGREQRCADVRIELSGADGRVIRRRKTRAHLRSCRNCRAFYEEIVKRQENLAAITTLPLAASASLLSGVLGGHTGGVGAASGGIGAAVGAAVGKGMATSTIVKSAATVAVAAVAVSAADSGSLLDLPRGGDGETIVQHASAAPRAPTESTSPSVKGSGFAGVGSSREQVANPKVGTEVQMQASPEAQPATPGAQLAVRELGRGENETTATSDIDAAEGSAPSDFPIPPLDSRFEDSDPTAMRSSSSEGLPESSAHGQQTAAAQQSPHVESPRGHGPSAKKPSKQSASTGPRRGKSEAPPGKPDGQPDEPDAPPGESAGPVESAGSAAAEPDAPGKSGKTGHGHSKHSDE